jgi:hypothetical protein
METHYRAYDIMYLNGIIDPGPDRLIRCILKGFAAGGGVFVLEKRN